MSGLNENHKRNVLSTFQEIDRLLTSAVSQLEVSESPSPLNSVNADADEMLISIAQNWLEDVRATMRSILEENGIDLPSPEISAVWNFRVSMIQAANYADNLRPRQMRQYGSLDPDAAAILHSISHRLRTQLESMLQLLEASRVNGDKHEATPAS
jgi:hypothetical protein